MKQQKEEVNKYDKIGEDSSIHTEDEILKFLEDMVNKSTDNISLEDRMKIYTHSCSEASKREFDSFLDDLTSNQEYPDEMEIFTSDRGWHKIKDYR